jgi:hypothetical protein
MADERTYPPAYPGRGEKKYFKEDEPETGMDRLKAAGGDIMRGINQGLVGSAFESFGQAFENDGNYANGRRPDLAPGMANWRQMGQNTQNALQHRWHQAEFKQFKEEYLDSFEAQAKSIGDQSSYLAKELDQNRWPSPDPGGEPEMFNPEDPTDQMKIFRYRAQLEKDTIMKITDMTIELANKASAKYGKNPLVDGMISQLYQHGADMGMQQFQPAQGATAERMNEMNMSDTQASTDLKRAQIRDLDSSAAIRKVQPKSISEAFTVHGPGGFKPWLTGSEMGQALISNQMPDAMLQAAANAEFVWRDRAGIEQNQLLDEDQQTDLQSELARSQDLLRQEALKIIVREALTTEQYAALESGTVANAGTDAETPGPWGEPGEDDRPPMVDNTTVMPKKEMIAKSDEWNLIAERAMQDEMKANPEKYETLDDGIAWVMSDWLENAISGKNPDPMLEGLTADPENPATMEYIAIVYERLAKFLKKHGNLGPGGGGLLPEQKAPRQRRAKGGAGRAGGLDKVISAAYQGLFGDSVDSPYRGDLNEDVLDPRAARKARKAREKAAK